MIKQTIIVLAALTVMACGGDPRENEDNIKYTHSTLVYVQDTWLGTIYDTCYNHNQECKVIPAGVKGVYWVKVNDIKKL